MIALEFPRRHLLGKQNIEFIEAPPLGFRQSKIGPNEGQKRCAAPDKPRVPFQVPLRRVDKIRFQDVGDDAGDVVCVARETDGLLAETSRSHLGGQAPAELPDGELEDKCPDEGEHRLGDGKGVLGGADVEEAD